MRNYWPAAHITIPLVVMSGIQFSPAFEAILLLAVTATLAANDSERWFLSAPGFTCGLSVTIS